MRLQRLIFDLDAECVCLYFSQPFFYLIRYSCLRVPPVPAADPSKDTMKSLDQSGSLRIGWDIKLCLSCSKAKFCCDPFLWISRSTRFPIFRSSYKGLAIVAKDLINFRYQPVIPKNLCNPLV